MKILHVTPGFMPAWVYGGPIETVYKLSLKTKELGHDVVVLTTNANGENETLAVTSSEEVLLEGDLRVRYCRRIGRGTFSLQMLYLLKRYILAADVIHLTGVYSLPTLPTLLLSSIYGKSVVWSPRGALQEWGASTKRRVKQVLNWAFRLASPKSLVLHVTSAQEAEESQARVPRAEFVIIPNGVDVTNHLKPKNKSGPLRLLYLGRIHPIKGIENLLKALAIVNNQKELEWSLVIAGTGRPNYTDSIRVQIRDLDMLDQIRMIGHANNSEKVELFRNAHILVVPSHTENFAVVVGEALASGVPVIASWGTPWAGLEANGCGLWVDNDPDSLAKAIREISQMPLREMGRKGQAWMREDFSWHDIAKQMQAVYRNLIEAES